MKFSKFLRNTKFSNKIVIIYTCIVVIPLFIIFLTVCGIVGNNQYKDLWQRSNETLQNNCNIIEENVHNIDYLEQLLAANKELMLFLLLPESIDSENFTNYLIERTTMVDNVLSVLPSIYGLRIFANNPIIPERWPIFLKSTRTDLSNIDYWEYNYKADYLGNLDQQKFDSVCTTRVLKKNKHDVGYLQVSLRMHDYFPFLYTRKSDHENDYAFKIIDTSNEKKLLPITNVEIEEIQPLLAEEELSKITEQYFASVKKDFLQFTLTINKNMNLVSCRTVDETDLLVVHVSSLKQFQKSFMLIITVIILAFISVMIALYFVVSKTTGKLMSGIYSVMDGMKKVRAGDFTVEIPIYVNDEVGETQKTFNLMTEQIKNQIEEIKKEQELIADTEIKAMQNQINVHFLYNVLETIKMQAVIADQDDIVESMTILGKMMRYCLRWKVHIVPLAQEIEYAFSYIYILNLRNDYVISLQTEIPEDLHSVEVPKMILQPLIENSFTHTIEPEGKDAIIKVYTKIDIANNKLYLCEKDFGCGMSQEQLEKIRSYLEDNSYEKDSVGSIGLKNIQQRLTMTYGKDYRIIINSVENKGTEILIPLPLPERRIRKSETNISSLEGTK